MNASKKANSNQSEEPKDKWRVLFHQFLDVLTVMVCLCLVFQLVGHGLCKVTINQIEELTNTKIEVESIDFRVNGSVVIKGLIVRGVAAAESNNNEVELKYDDTILRAETVRSRFGIGSLLLFRPRLKSITVIDFAFNALYDTESGRWNLSGITSGEPKIGAGNMPSIHFEKGKLQYSKTTETGSEVLIEVGIDVKLVAAEKPEGIYVFNITTSEGASFGESKLRGTWRHGKITVVGAISSPLNDTLKKKWSADVLAGEFAYDWDKSYSLKLTIRDLVYRNGVRIDKSVLTGPLSPEVWGGFGTLQEFFDQYRPQGQADVRFEVRGNLNRLLESKIDGEVYCKDVSICNRKFSYAIENLVGPLNFTEKSVTLNNLSGRHKEVKVNFNGWREGFGENRQYEIDITSENMVLDEDFYRALSAKWQKQWSAFSPMGLTAISYHFSREPETGRTKTLILKPLGANATYQYFPYPLKNLTGEIIVTKDKVELKEVVAREANDVETGTKGSVIKIDGEISLVDDNFKMCELSIRGSDVRLDERVESALPENIKLLYGKMLPAGRFDPVFENLKIINTTDGKYIDFGGAVGFKDFKFKISPAIIELDVGLKELKGLYKVGDGFFDISGAVIARCDEGRLLGAFKLKQTEEVSEYAMQGGFENIELNRFVLGTKPRENTQNERISGKVSGLLSVAGQLGESYGRIGRCKLTMRDMEVGRPSPLGQILGALKLSGPKAYAFDEMYVNSYIRQDKVLIEKLDLSGEGLAFNGSGWVDLANEDVSLTLMARGSRLATAEPSVLQSLTDVVGLGVVRMKVGGSIYKPEVTTTTLPVIGDTLGILGGGD